MLSFPLAARVIPGGLLFIPELVSRTPAQGVL